MAAESPRSSFVEPLPDRPNLEMQQKRAKDLARAVWARDAAAMARVNALHPHPPAIEDFALADAQLVVARGYGFDSWPAMKRKIDSLTMNPVQQFVMALRSGNVDRVRELLAQHAEVRAAVNAPICAFDGRPVSAAATNLPMLDVLIEYGADLNLKSAWWAGGFGLLEYDCTPEQAAPLIARGAEVDIFAAANLKMFDRVRELVEHDPALVRARGGDGKTALHLAGSVEIAEFLLSRGAEIDARCVDHESTPAQYLVRAAPDVVRFLIDRGAWVDIFMAVGLNDGALVEKCLREDAAALDHQIGRGLYQVAHNGSRAATREEIGNRRGDIYRWIFGHHLSALDVAARLHLPEMTEVLLASANPAQRLLAAASRGDANAARAVVSADPQIVGTLGKDALRLLPERAQGCEPEAVRLMLEIGFDVHAIGPNGGDALHWAAFHGSPEMVDALLRHGASVTARDQAYQGTALGWCLHGAVEGWLKDAGDYPRTVQLLVDAGSPVDPQDLPTGRDDLDQLLRAHLARR